MYRTSSTLSNFEDNNKVLPKKSKIVMLAKTDLFAECLTQAISSRFQDQDIVSLSDADGLLDGNLIDVSLVMLYRLPAAAFPSIMRTIHEFHPKTAIGLMVQNADELDSSIAGFVDEGLVHGVLSLNLNLDVCLTAIDLLMKGGEHFPAALLRRLAPRGLAGGGLVAQNRLWPRPPDDARDPDSRSHLYGHAEQDHRLSSRAFRKHRQGACPQHLYEDERAQSDRGGVALLPERR
jgi:DNA-binding NarL/FixJ family response regulator